jgi:hypothetical protein
MSLLFRGLNVVTSSWYKPEFKEITQTSVCIYLIISLLSKSISNSFPQLLS